MKLALQVAVDLTLQVEEQLAMLLAVHLGLLAWKNCTSLETVTKLIRGDLTFRITVDLASNEVVELALYLAEDMALLRGNKYRSQWNNQKVKVLKMVMVMAVMVLVMMVMMVMMMLVMVMMLIMVMVMVVVVGMVMVMVVIAIVMMVMVVMVVMV